MTINNIIIVGCNIVGLYSAMRCVDSGFKVSIVDRLSKDKINIKKRNNYRVLNKSHHLYIQLLNRFSINYEKYVLKYNDKTNNIIASIIYKSKLIPKKSLNSQSFVKFCRSILAIGDYNILKANLEAYEYIYSNISAMDALIMFSSDINVSQEYYILTDDITLLINRITQYLQTKNVDFHYNTEIKDIIYCNNIVYSSTRFNTFISNIIILAISKNNLLKFNVFTKEQKKLLNNVSKYNIDCESIYTDKYLKSEYNIKTHLLDNLHIVCPIKKHCMYLWNYGINNIIIRDKIKNLFTHIFICSDSYSRNNFFINYTFETFDIIYSKMNNRMTHIY
uniref:FAD dependent oxidoreductase domain-containing protein n=1 Tax=viral metagenome TaxID=1070528 RepID=A0A6C0I936_9ZZZZ